MLEKEKNNVLKKSKSLYFLSVVSLLLYAVVFITIKETYISSLCVSDSYLYFDIIICLLSSVFIFTYTKFKLNFLLPVIFIFIEIKNFSLSSFSILDWEEFFKFFCALFGILYLISFIKVLKHKERKGLILLPFILNIIFSICFFSIIVLMVFYNPDEFVKEDIIINTLYPAAQFFTLITLALLLKHNTFSLVIKKEKVKEDLTDIKNKIPVEQFIAPEKALPLLKEKFEQGLISEEEYNKKRAEIISKL